MERTSNTSQKQVGPSGGFTAFISYSQRDAKLAKRLHLALKAYSVPERVKVDNLAEGRKLGRFFRDEENMGADASLGDALDSLIDSAKNLIVLCSPDSAQSEWVEKEVRRFKFRAQPNMLAVIARGHPHSDDPSTECFCPALKVKFDESGQPTLEKDEPLAPNLQRESFNKVLARLVAGLLDIPFDELWRHDLRRTIRRRSIYGISLTILALTFLVGMFETIRVFDATALSTQSTQIARDAWARGADDEVFHRAFRAAFAATALPGDLFTRNNDESLCNLAEPIANGSCALALSGHALAHIRLFDERPAQRQGNFRDDIEGADGISRRALRLDSYVLDLTFSGDSKRVGMLHSDGRLMVYDMVKRSIVFDKHISTRNRGPLALNEDGTLALAVTEDQELVTVNLSSGTLSRLETTATLVHDIAISGSIWRIVTTDFSKQGSQIFEFQDGKQTKEIAIERYTPYASQGFTNSNEKFLSFSSGMSSSLYLTTIDNAVSQQIEFDDLGLGVGQVKAIATDANGKWAAIGGNGSGGIDNAAQVISLTEGRETARLAGHTGEIYTIAFSPNGDLVVTGGSDLTVRLWAREPGIEILRLAGHASDIVDVEISPDGNLLATTASDGLVLLWDLSEAQRPGTDALRDAVCSESPGPFTRPGVLLPTSERGSILTYHGRPWDLCEWRGTGHLSGFLQSIRTSLVRWSGARFLDPVMN